MIGCQRGNATLCLIPRNHTSRRRSRGAWVNGHGAGFRGKGRCYVGRAYSRGRAVDRYRPDPSPAPRPERLSHEGRYALVEPLDPDTHAAALYAASHGDPERERIWDYLPYGPFARKGSSVLT